MCLCTFRVFTVSSFALRVKQQARSAFPRKQPLQLFYAQRYVAILFYSCFLAPEFSPRYRIDRQVLFATRRVHLRVAFLHRYTQDPFLVKRDNTVDQPCHFYSARTSQLHRAREIDYVPLTN